MPSKCPLLATRRQDLASTGKSIIVISAGSGHFEVEHRLSKITQQRLIDNGIGCDLVCCSSPPLHTVPIFTYVHSRSDVDLPGEASSFRVPHWMLVSYTDAPPHPALPHCRVTPAPHLDARHDASRQDGGSGGDGGDGGGGSGAAAATAAGAFGAGEVPLGAGQGAASEPLGPFGPLLLPCRVPPFELPWLPSASDGGATSHVSSGELVRARSVDSDGGVFDLAAALPEGCVFARHTAAMSSIGHLRRTADGDEDGDEARVDEEEVGGEGAGVSGGGRPGGSGGAGLTEGSPAADQMWDEEATIVSSRPNSRAPRAALGAQGCASARSGAHASVVGLSSCCTSGAVAGSRPIPRPGAAGRYDARYDARYDGRYDGRYDSHDEGIYGSPSEMDLSSSFGSDRGRQMACSLSNLDLGFSPPATPLQLADGFPLQPSRHVRAASGDHSASASSLTHLPRQSAIAGSTHLLPSERASGAGGGGPHATATADGTARPSHRLNPFSHADLQALKNLSQNSYARRRWMYVNHIGTDKGSEGGQGAAGGSFGPDPLHLSPYTNSSILQHQEHQWTSLSEPAVLPLTTDPTPEQMRMISMNLQTGPSDGHTRHFWQLDVPRQEDLSGIPYEVAMSAEELLQELLCQRLEQDFQLLRPRHQARLLSLHQEQTYYVSRGDQVQQITFVQKEQPVVQPRRHHAPTDLGRATASVGGRVGAVLGGGHAAAARQSSGNSSSSSSMSRGALGGAQGAGAHDGAPLGGVAAAPPVAPQASFSEIRVTRHLLQPPGSRQERAAAVASGASAGGLKSTSSASAASISPSKRLADKALDYRYYVCDPHSLGYQTAAALMRPTTSFDQYPWNSLDQVVCGWDCTLISLPMRPRCKRFALLDFSGAEDSLRRLLSAPEGTQRLLAAALFGDGVTPGPPPRTPSMVPGLTGAAAARPLPRPPPPPAATSPSTPPLTRCSATTPHSGGASPPTAQPPRARRASTSGVDDMTPRDVNAPSLSRDRFDRFREAVRSKLPIGDRVEWVEAAAAAVESEGSGGDLSPVGTKGGGSAHAQRTHSQLLDLTSVDDTTKGTATGRGERPRRMFVQLLFDANASGEQAWHLELRWTMCQSQKVEELIKFCARRAKQAGLLLLQVPTGRRPRPFSLPVLVPIPSALQAKALLLLRTELCFLRESVHAGTDLHAGRSTAALGDRWMHELGVAFVQRDKYGRGFLWSANRCMPSAEGRAHSIDMLTRFREICEALTIMDRTGPLFTGILGRAEMATAVAEQQWDWSDGRCSLDSSGSRAGLAVEAALQASESVPPSPLSADSLEQESPSPRKGGGSLWLSKGDDFGTEVSVGSAHG